MWAVPAPHCHIENACTMPASVWNASALLIRTTTPWGGCHYCPHCTDEQTVRRLPSVHWSHNLIVWLWVWFVAAVRNSNQLRLLLWDLWEGKWYMEKRAYIWSLNVAETVVEFYCFFLPRILGMSGKEMVQGWRTQEDVSRGEFTSGQQSANAINGCMFASQESAFMQIKVRKRGGLLHFYPTLNFIPSFVFLQLGAQQLIASASVISLQGQWVIIMTQKQSKLCMVQISSVFWSCWFYLQITTGSRGF